MPIPDLAGTIEDVKRESAKAADARNEEITALIDPSALRCGGCGHGMSRVLEGGKVYAKCQNGGCKNQEKLYAPPEIRLKRML